MPMGEFVFYSTLLVSIVFVLGLIYLLVKGFAGGWDDDDDRRPTRTVHYHAVASNSGNVRHRARNRQRNEDEDDDDDDDGNEDYDDYYAGGAMPDDTLAKMKIGVKKQRKLEMKAERKAERERELIEREERKKLQEELEERRKLKEEKEAAQEKAREEAERLEKERKEREEYEEYLKLKESFAVDEEGFDGDVNEEDGQNKLQAFIEYIQNHKVVQMDELAGHFNLKTQEVVARIQSLLEQEQLIGVIDDRGKFISITNDELQAVAKFIRQRGRVSITDLVENSNTFVNLVPIEADNANKKASRSLAREVVSSGGKALRKGGQWADTFELRFDLFTWKERLAREIVYDHFSNKNLIFITNMDSGRLIPSLVDGLKSDQRKVLFTFFKRNDDESKVNVAQLVRWVVADSACHRDEQSLTTTIIGLAHNFPGSNNINYLQPLGHFGTRHHAGQDAVSPHYIFTMLSPLTRKLFPALDDPLLDYHYADNLRIEPKYYMPIIPTVLVNGVEGDGSGWSIKVPNYNPRDIVANIKRLLNYEELKAMTPWWKGFNGMVHEVEPQAYVVNGVVNQLDDHSFEIVELPVGTCTQTYEKTVLEPLANVYGQSYQYKDYHTDDTVKFLIKIDKINLRHLTHSNMIHKHFKLSTTLSTSSMVLLNSTDAIRRYDSELEILREFYELRLNFYAKRKKYYVGMFQAEALKLENQVRFICDKKAKQIVMTNSKGKDFLQALIELNYDSDPVAAWEKKNKIVDYEEGPTKNGQEPEANVEGGFEYQKYDFDYLIDMTMRGMSHENVTKLSKQCDDKKAELEKLRQTTLKQLWVMDLDSFLLELDRMETKERKNFEKIGQIYKPSVNGKRIVPKIDKEVLDGKNQQNPNKGIKRKLDDEVIAELDTKTKKKKVKGNGFRLNGGCQIQ